MSDEHTGPDDTGSDNSSPSENGQFSADDLGRALHDVLDHVERGGWGQPPQVFALVPTRLIAAQNPELVDEGDDSALSPVAQEPLEVAGGEEPYARLEEFLATATWYPPVEGVALILEIVVLPPDAEGDLDSAFEPLLGDPAASESAAREAARAHPSARTARLAVGALRNGKRLSLMRLRPGPDDDPDGPMELLTHPELASTLQAALAATLDDRT